MQKDSFLQINPGWIAVVTCALALFAIVLYGGGILEQIKNISPLIEKVQSLEKDVAILKFQIPTCNQCFGSETVQAKNFK